MGLGTTPLPASQARLQRCPRSSAPEWVFTPRKVANTVNRASSFWRPVCCTPLAWGQTAEEGGRQRTGEQGPSARQSPRGRAAVLGARRGGVAWPLCVETVGRGGSGDTQRRLGGREPGWLAALTL